MLNYVWLILIVLGISTAVISDIGDELSEKFPNDKVFNSIVIETKSGEQNEGSINAELLITPEEFKHNFNCEIDDTLRFGLAISAFSLAQKRSAVFTINKNTPEIIKEMASAKEGEDDLTAEITLIKSLGSNKYSAEIKFEKIGFVKLSKVTKAALDYAGIAVEIVLGLIGIMALWLGIMKIAEEAGVINYIARAAKPLTKFLFPDVPQDHPAIGSIIMNLSATFLGLGNAATPFGIKAMEDLNKLNDTKDTATNAMCTFLVLNTASFALMPTTAIALRAAAGSSQPAVIIGTTMFGSFCATVVGVTVTKIFEKFPLSIIDIGNWFKQNLKFLLISFMTITAFILMGYMGVLKIFNSIFEFVNPDLLRNLIQIVSTLAIPSIIFIFVTLGIIKKVKIYETFVEGAKEGFEIAVTIIPYLVAILVAIGIFRAGGGMNYLVYLLDPVTQFIGMPSEAIPMALMRPLSGSGSLGIMAEIISVHGPDSFIGILVSTMFGSTETTFYVLAVYFGAVNIKKTRYALPAGLISDVAGILAALFIVRLLFA